MYNNIGKKLKLLAKIDFFFNAIATFIAGIAILASLYADYGEDTHLAIGLVLMLVGPIAAWVSSWLLYAFGQLVENSDKIVAKLDASDENAPASDPAKAE